MQQKGTILHLQYDCRDSRAPVRIGVVERIHSLELPKYQPENLREIGLIGNLRTVGMNRWRDGGGNSAGIGEVGVLETSDIRPAENQSIKIYYGLMSL
jgi:hypothetical protein